MSKALLCVLTTLNSQRAFACTCTVRRHIIALLFTLLVILFVWLPQPCINSPQSPLTPCVCVYACMRTGICVFSEPAHVFGSVACILLSSQLEVAISSPWKPVWGLTGRYICMTLIKFLVFYFFRFAGLCLSWCVCLSFCSEWYSMRLWGFIFDSFPFLLQLC